MRPVTLALFFCITCFSTLAQDKTLYQRLGGQPAVESIVKNTLGRFLADARINKRFAYSNADNLIAAWMNIICNKTGGDCKEPKNKKKIKITQAEWEAGIEDITQTLDFFYVPKKEKTELLEVINSLREKYFD